MIKIFANCRRELTYKSTVFSGGEVQVWLDKYDFYTEPDMFYVEAHLTDSNEVMKLLLLTDALRRTYGHIPIKAVIPYLPYARQDRAMTEGESLSLKIMCELINSLKFDIVEVWDVHSDVSLALLDNVIHKPVHELLDPDILGDSILVSPDAGALKKVSKVAQTFGRRMVRADKTRSVKDGSITGTVVYSGWVEDSSFLMVDDICDGGRTFIELAKSLRELTAGKVDLYVTHGIFSKGLDVLTEYIDTIYCCLPFPGVDVSNPKLKVTGRW